MTKLRDAASHHGALMTVARTIGWRRAARIAGRSERTLRAWSEPDADRRMPFEVALRLDIACLDAGADVAPFEAAYQAQMAIARARASVAVAGNNGADHVATAMRETSEAFAAHYVAAQPGAMPAALQIADRETREAIVALGRTLSPRSSGRRIRR
jgi:hypothetical protein